MGHIRSIKPEAFLSERLYDAEAEAQLPLRWAYAGLWTQADREGRFPWRPRALKASVLPYDACDFGAVLDALEAHGFIERYEAEGRTWGWIKGFREHQRPNQREPASRLPAAPGDHEGGARARTRTHGPAPAAHERDQDTHAGKGREGKGTEGDRGRAGAEVARGAETEQSRRGGQPPCGGAACDRPLCCDVGLKNHQAKAPAAGR